MNAKQNASDQQAIHGKRGPKGQKKKNNLGREKTCSVKRACEGARKRPPPHTKRPWTQRVRGSPAPQATKDADKIPKKGAANMPPPKNGPSPGSHSSEGWVRLPSGLVKTTPGLSRKSVAAKRKRGKRKTKQEKHTKTLAASRPKKKGLRRSKENPKNARGPEWHPGKTPRSGTHGQNGRNREKRRDTKKKKKQKNRCV